MATILDVAKEAGVSPATVSRVINNSLVVSATKRSHVLAAIEKLGYELPTTRTGSSGKLIIVVSTMPGLELYNALYRAIEARGYQMLHYYYCEGPSTENELFDFLQTMAPTQKIAGIVLSNSLSNAAAPLRNALNTYPVVQIGGGCCPLNQTIRFEVDPFRAAYDAASLLIDRGCRRIAICISDSTVSTDQSRLNGYRAAVLDHGLALDPALTIEADCTAEGAFEATEHLLKSGAPLPDGVIFPVDTMSVGCMNALNRNGVRVPEQIKLISLFDNWYSEFTTPGLSTLRFPYEQLSTEAIRYLDMLISGESVSSQTIHIPHSFVLRGSTGDPE